MVKNTNPMTLLEREVDYLRSVLDDNMVPTSDAMGELTLGGRLQDYITHITDRLGAAEAARLALQRERDEALAWVDQGRGILRTLQAQRDGLQDQLDVAEAALQTLRTQIGQLEQEMRDFGGPTDVAWADRLKEALT